MKKLFTALSLFASLTLFSQKVTVSGTAFDSTKDRSMVQIVLNDTLRKHRINQSRPARERWAEYQKLTKDTNYVVWAKGDGKFRIKAERSDSLHFHAYRHHSKVYAVADLLQMDSIRITLEPEVCLPYTPCNDTTPARFFAFVGEKIRVKGVQPVYYCNVYPMDSEFEAEYRILQEVYGDYEADTMRFKVFDHYGAPVFSQYSHVLLFVSEYCGRLYQEKYQYFELFPTADGRWASPGDPYRYDNYHRKDLKARSIAFADSVFYDLSPFNRAYIEKHFPEPYFRIEGQKAIPLMGAYIDDLITVKREGVLKARKISMD